MIKNTLEVMKKLSDEGLIKDISISVFKNNQIINDFNKFDNKKHFHIFSAGKPFIAAVIWKLHDKKILNFNDPIIKYWPEFGKNYKNNIKIKDVLTHTSGVSKANDLMDNDYIDLNRVSRWLENYNPESKPGSRIAYHEVTFGWILGEIIQRVTNKTFEDNFKELVSNPLKLKNSSFTLSKNNFPLEIIKHSSSNLKNIPIIFKFLLINKIPLISGTCISTSLDLAKFYNELINNKNWISEKTKNKVLSVHAQGIDYNSKLKYSKLGLGVILDSNLMNERGSNYLNKTFGHSGLVSCTGWGSKKEKISISILNNLLLSSSLNVYRLNLLSSAIKKDLNTI
tara:strand:+ start:5808 stop:6827 length:1020 start_codon:yes stop_codon:yes gene_type:complete